ncbi:MAG: efflux RND transporter periplasmic adaptor subunit [Candidatus Cloacimonetes bacterium]|nr:efflux RND transporter periplasmic adaptor subunit [Candidatus Cloacimonadota bacterium]
MKKKIFIIIIIAAALAGGLLYAQFQRNQSRLTWRTTPASNRTVTSTITATGTINPVVQVNVGTEVSGRIERIYKDFNDTVRRGELLARLDTTTLQMALEDTRIELRKAQLTANDNLIDLNRAKELFEANMVPQFDLQRAQLNYDISVENVERANFSVQRAETNLNNALIYSPIDGVIVSRAVDEGQTVAASLNAPTLFIIANNLDEMQIETQIDETDIGRVASGQRARFTIDAYPDMNFSGQVRQVRLNPIVESNVVTYRVIIDFNNPEKLIMPGMSANVEIIIDQVQNTLAIQERALQFRPSKEIWESFGLKWDDALAQSPRGRLRQQVGAAQPTQQIWVLQDGLPVQVSIQTGISDGSFIQVLSGLDEGQEVIIGVNHPETQRQSGGMAFGGSGGGQRVIRM